MPGKIYYDAKGFPLYDPKDGWKSEDEFQAAALNDMAKHQDNELKKTQNGTAAGKMLATILPSVGGGLGALVPGAGETGLSEVVGAGLGTAVKNALRNRHPEIFGENPEGLSGIADNVTDVATGALPGLTSLVGKGAGFAAKMGSSIIGSRIGKHISTLVDSLSQLSPSAQMAAKIALRGVGIAAKMPSEDSQPQQ
jgi:hypothetical protein